MSVWDRIERSREKWNVLEHPFYQRWSNGELTREELAAYSGQYRRAVEAIAEMTAKVADALPEREELRSHAAEERGHVRLWDGFVDAVGGDTAANPNEETERCAGTWTAGEDAVELLARLYAVESGQPEISKTKREGLIERYGFDDGAGTAYFRVHSTRDVEHADEVRELLTELGAEDGAAGRVVAAAEEAFRANWQLLDGVEARAAAA